MRNWIADKFGRNRGARPVITAPVVASPPLDPTDWSVSYGNGTVTYTIGSLRRDTYQYYTTSFNYVTIDETMPQHPAHVRLPDGV